MYIYKYLLDTSYLDNFYIFGMERNIIFSCLKKIIYYIMTLRKYE